MSTWGEPESRSEEVYPVSLLKHVLRQMMAHFSAQGACLALYDESIGQMRIRLHVRARSTLSTPGTPGTSSAAKPAARSMTVHLENTDPSAIPSAQFSPSSSSPTLPSLPTLPSSPAPTARRIRAGSQPLPALSQPLSTATVEEVDDISHAQSELFAVGTTYPIGNDIIGYTWFKNEAYTMRQDDYLALFHDGQPLPYQTDIVPLSYLSVPLREALNNDVPQSNKSHEGVMGVIVLYQGANGPYFQSRQRNDALLYAEKIALQLQNEKLRRGQRRTSDYLQRLQAISMAFPTTVLLKDLVESVYDFAIRTVDVSSMLLTLYDRDTHGVYDVFALNNGQRVEGLIEQPVIDTEEHRPVWWRVTQKEKQRIHFSPINDAGDRVEYYELLHGVWGEQDMASTFLLLPMTMFKRVTGSLCLTSMRPDAYQPQEIQVLETMLQIVTVSIENAKLYERDRKRLREANQREEQLTEAVARLRQRETELAGMNSALQSVSLVLDLKELLNKFVASVAELVKSEMCVYFQLSPDEQEFMAKAIYAPPSESTYFDPDTVDSVAVGEALSKNMHDDLIEQIRLPFKGTPLEQRVREEGFFYLDHADMEALVQKSEEGGIIFLQVADVQQMLMIPVMYQTRLFGILAVHTLKEKSFFNPREVGTLLAICAQAATAIRNAQLFEQREEAYAELQRMDKLKDEFLVTASHELRTPLSAISGYASLLKKQCEREQEHIPAKQIMRYSNKIADATQQLTDLVSSMTEAAKMGAIEKNLELHPTSVQLLAAAKLATNLVKVNAEQRITLAIPADLWVYADVLRLRQVLTNLLDNAAKYSPPDGFIHVDARAMTLEDVVDLLPPDQAKHSVILDHGHEPIVLIRVHDQGEGIALEDQQKIFDKFVRAPRSLTTPVRGTGLGLFICRRYVEAMHGKLWLEKSDPKTGSIFSFFVPRIAAPQTATGE